MDIELATTVIYETAAAKGEPLTMDVARQIAVQLFPPPFPIDLKPGEIARLHRQRYEGEPK